MPGYSSYPNIFRGVNVLPPPSFGVNPMPPPPNIDLNSILQKLGQVRDIPAIQAPAIPPPPNRWQQSIGDIGTMLRASFINDPQQKMQFLETQRQQPMQDRANALAMAKLEYELANAPAELASKLNMNQANAFRDTATAANQIQQAAQLYFMFPIEERLKTLDAFVKTSGIQLNMAQMDELMRVLPYKIEEKKSLINQHNQAAALSQGRLNALSQPKFIGQPTQVEGGGWTSPTYTPGQGVGITNFGTTPQAMAPISGAAQKPKEVSATQAEDIKFAVLNALLPGEGVKGTYADKQWGWGDSRTEDQQLMNTARENPKQYSADFIIQHLSPAMRPQAIQIIDAVRKYMAQNPNTDPLVALQAVMGSATTPAPTNVGPTPGAVPIPTPVPINAVSPSTKMWQRKRNEIQGVR